MDRDFHRWGGGDSANRKNELKCVPATESFEVQGVVGNKARKGNRCHCCGVLKADEVYFNPGNRKP